MNEDKEISKDTEAMMQFDAAKKSVGVAYLLWFFLGGFGVHRFYLGRTGSAIAMLVIWIVSWLTLVLGVGLVGFIVIGIWWIVDAFLIFGIVRSFNEELISKIKSGS